MATYRKILKDKDGNNIIPALAGDETGWVKPADLEDTGVYDRLVAVGGTEITSNADLNTITYLAIGMYYCVSDNVAATLTNCPTGSAFTMRVYRSSSNVNPDVSTDTWVYLVRKITTWDCREYIQYVYSDSTPGNFTYSGWGRMLDKRDVKTLNSVSDAGWEADRNYIPDLGFMAYWNGAYSGTASNLKYFAPSSVTTSNLQDGCIDPNKFNDWQTANTVDTWVPVTSMDKIQHRVIKPFNADGSVPASACADDVAKTAYTCYGAGTINLGHIILTGTTGGDAQSATWYLPVNKSMDLVNISSLSIASDTNTHFGFSIPTGASIRPVPGTISDVTKKQQCISFKTQLNNSVGNYQMVIAQFGDINVTFTLIP